jgi:Salmonella virulence plasmid 65kDa B protein
MKSYRPRTEGLFASIERWTRLEDGDTHWRSISKDNVLTVYGFDINSRIADPLNPVHIFSWLVCRSYDDKGNAIIYDYATEDDRGIDTALPSERQPSARVTIWCRYYHRTHTPRRSLAALCYSRWG